MKKFVLIIFLILSLLPVYAADYGEDVVPDYVTVWKSSTTAGTHNFNAVFDGVEYTELGFSSGQPSFVLNSGIVKTSFTDNKLTMKKDTGNSTVGKFVYSNDLYIYWYISAKCEMMLYLKAEPNSVTTTTTDETGTTKTVTTYDTTKIVVTGDYTKYTSSTTSTTSSSSGNSGSSTKSKGKTSTTSTSTSGSIIHTVAEDTSSAQTTFTVTAEGKQGEAAVAYFPNTYSVYQGDTKINVNATISSYPTNGIIGKLTLELRTTS